MTGGRWRRKGKGKRARGEERRREERMRLWRGWEEGRKAEKESATAEKCKEIGGVIFTKKRLTKIMRRRKEGDMFHLK